MIPRNLELFYIFFEKISIYFTYVDDHCTIWIALYSVCLDDQWIFENLTKLFKIIKCIF